MTTNNPGRERTDSIWRGTLIGVISGMAVSILFYLLVVYKWLPSLPLRVRITDTSGIRFRSADMFVSASGTISGIVSDTDAAVYLLAKRIEPNSAATYWHISEATVDAEGNWKAAFLVMSGGFDVPPVDFWEFFAIATERPSEIRDLIVPQVGAILEENLKKVKRVVSCPSIVRTRSEGLYVDPESIPKPRKVL